MNMDEHEGIHVHPSIYSWYKDGKKIHSHTTIANSNMKETEIELVVHEIKQTRI